MTCDCIYLNAYYCMLFSSTVMTGATVMIIFIFWLVNGDAHVFMLRFVVTVTLPSPIFGPILCFLATKATADR